MNTIFFFGFARGLVGHCRFVVLEQYYYNKKKGSITLPFPYYYRLVPQIGHLLKPDETLFPHLGQTIVPLPELVALEEFLFSTSAYAFTKLLVVLVSLIGLAAMLSLFVDPPPLALVIPPALPPTLLLELFLDDLEDVFPPDEELLDPLNNDS